MENFKLQPLGSPAFIAALALLVLNDFAFKPLFHNWATGKLSDFAGLFASAFFCATLWPRHRGMAGVALTVAFALWKSALSQPAVDWLNAFTPFPVTRTVDYSDLSAIPAIWLGLRAAHRTRAWALPRSAQLTLALLAPFAFAATSGPPAYLVRGTMIAEPISPDRTSETELQATFEELTRAHDMKCTICDPLSEGRVYGGGPEPLDFLAVNFDDETDTLSFHVRSRPSRSPPKDVERFVAEIRATLAERFPDLKLVEFVESDSYHDDPSYDSVQLTVRIDSESLDVGVAESAKRTLSAIIEQVVREHGLEVDAHSLVYYAGKRLGPSAYHRELTLTTHLQNHATFVVNLRCDSAAYEGALRTIAADLEERLRAAFGPEHVTVDD
jgi:hypothetical protein